MNDQKEVNLALAVAVAAAKSHNGCAPETCGGSRLDPCALGNALDDLTSYQRSAGYISTLTVAWAPDGCTCRADAQENCHAPDCQGGKNISYWVPRTWADVRRGDVVRMPGQEATAAEVMELVTLEWHVNDRPPAQNQGEPGHAYAERVKAFNKDVQYRPNEHAGEWAARPVTLRPLAADDLATRHRIPNVNPGAPVEIRCTQVELDAIELLGGWSQRTAVASTPA
jgi:hypothetical protein